MVLGFWYTWVLVGHMGGRVAAAGGRQASDALIRLRGPGACVAPWLLMHDTSIVLRIMNKPTFA